jgi:hypothetical protein
VPALTKARTGCAYGRPRRTTLVTPGRGYFHHYIATVDGDWAAPVCDDCCTGLHPGIMVTVNFEDTTEISREEAERIATGPAARHRPPDVARPPWAVSAYPES